MKKYFCACVVPQDFIEGGGGGDGGNITPLGQNNSRNFVKKGFEQRV